MSTLTIHLTDSLERYVDDAVRRGIATSRAGVVQEAIRRMSEAEAINAVLEAEQEIREGKVLYGDLRTLLKDFKE